MSEWCASCMNSPPGGNRCDGCNPDDPMESNYQSVRGKHGTSYDSTRVMCPFYKRILKPQKMIVCEGPFKDTTCTVFFSHGNRMRIQIACYCEGAYEHCELYKLIARKYEG